MALSDLAFSGQQAQQAGVTAFDVARFADPFMEERKKYQPKLASLMERPGDITSSPYYQFLIDEAMNQVNAQAAGSGLLKSGRRLSALQDRAQGVASQVYFPQANLLAKLAGVDSSSPAAAGLGYAEGMSRMQNYSAMGQAQRGMDYAGPRMPSSAEQSVDRMLAEMRQQNSMGNYGGAAYGLPSGGLAQMASAYAPSYSLSPWAGTGYIADEGGVTSTFGDYQDWYGNNDYGSGDYSEYDYTNYGGPDYFSEDYSGGNWYE